MKIKGVLALLFACTFDFTANGQILNHQIEVFGEDPFFNQEFISRHGIKTIIGTFSFKKDMKPIRKTDLFIEYSFNKNGQLTEVEQNRSIGKRMDTLHSYFFYDEEDQLVKKVIQDAYGYYALNYDYDASGNLSALSHSREVKSTDNTFEASSIVWVDMIDNQFQNDSTIKTTYANNLGKPYKEVLKKYNNHHCLISQKEMNLIGGDYVQKDFTRGTSCELSGLKINSTMANSEVRILNFDPNNILTEVRINRGGKEDKLIRLDYKMNGQLSLYLERDHALKELKIIEFDYRYW